jgi:hypothetical protein
MSVRGAIWEWNVTDEERWASYPCDGYVTGPHRVLMRAIDVQAPVELMYRWLCQLTVAPYSYEWIDNWGRRSPRELTPGAERLEGRDMLECPIAEFETNSHITVTPSTQMARVYGIVALTYAVRPAKPGACRVVMKCALRYGSRPERARAELVAWGDFVMMRKQLRTLKALAERDARRGVAAG